MQFILVNEGSDVKLGKTSNSGGGAAAGGSNRNSNNNTRSSFVFVFKVGPAISGDHSDSDTRANNLNDGEEMKNLFSEMTEGKQSILRVILSPLQDEENYELVVRCSKSGSDVLKNLQKRFEDKVMISVEIYPPEPDFFDEDDVDGYESCIFSKGMLIDEMRGTCKAHSRYMRRFDLEELKCSTALSLSPFHVRVVAHIEDDQIIRNLSLMKETNKMILENGVGSDVVITAGNGVEVKSHKCFLVAKSSVLKRMLAGGMEESKSGRIDMSDISEEGVRAFLRYLYLGEVMEGDVDLAFYLLYAAHKYNVTGLEKSVKAELIKKKDEDFPVDLAFKIYSFVRGMESASDLKYRVLEVMHSKFEELKDTSEFKEVFQKNPGDAIEICSNLVRIKSSPKKEESGCRT